MKKRDNIYEAFLSAIDEDLRGMCEENGKAELPLPCPYCGEKNIERLAKSLVGVLEERSPDIPGLVSEQYRADVHEARELLTAATLALLPLYFPPRDSRIGSVATVVSMFRHGRTAGYKSAGVLLFEEVATGMKYSTKQGAYIPSSFVPMAESHATGCTAMDRVALRRMKMMPSCFTSATSRCNDVCSIRVRVSTLSYVSNARLRHFWTNDTLFITWRKRWKSI